ncbi:MAG: CAP domain-containing protein [Paracoccaceae bacterium]
MTTIGARAVLLPQPAERLGPRLRAGIGPALARRAGVLLALLIAAPLSALSASDPVPAASIAINALRMEAGREPLRADPALQRAAEIHADAMARDGFFAHQGPDGDTVAERVRAEGFGFCFVAENIARGQRDLAEALASWMASAGHRRNLLARQAEAFGLARSERDHWVLVLGRDGC